MERSSRIDADKKTTFLISRTRSLLDSHSEIHHSNWSLLLALITVDSYPPLQTPLGPDLMVNLPVPGIALITPIPSNGSGWRASLKSRSQLA